MKNKDPRSEAYVDRSSRIVPVTLMLIVLCGFSFYLGGIYCSEKNRYFNMDVEPAIQLRNKSASTSLQIDSVEFPVCGGDYQDYTPCTDPKVYSTSDHYN